MQTLTINGKTETFTKNQISRFTSQIKKGKQNTAAILAMPIKRGSEHGFSSLAAHAGAEYIAAREKKAECLSLLLNVADTLQLLRTLAGDNDRQYGAMIADTPLASMPASDRSDLKWLGENKALVRKAVKQAEANGVHGLGISALRKRANKLAKETGTKTKTVRNTSAKSKGKAKAAGTVSIEQLVANVVTVAAAHKIELTDVIEALQAVVAETA